MRNSVGYTMKASARPLAIVEFIVVIIISFAYYDSPNFLFLFGGTIFVWLSNLILYAIGQISDDIHAIRTKDEIQEECKDHNSKQSETHAKQNGIKY